MENAFQINNNPKKRTLIYKGFKAFANGEYKKALFFFSEALFLDKDDLNAKIGLLLSDMATDFPREAYGFYELYQNLINTQPRAARTKVQKQILDIIKSFDANLNKMSNLIYDEDSIKAESIDGILYKDFKQMCQNKNFKEIFQNLMFSTKIIFTSKNDFYDFLDLLVENDFYEMSISYIENMRSFTLYDKKINEILQKAVEKQSENTKTN
ncbi:histidine kinase [Helicobacter sp. 12S02232-10]|uniref:histidine kinase n=1 Tax=Helicobacter sp. 12S02232-10 TaxID=1476197 RepID=UPI000BA5C38D|nr:histidine kinase [Helicobacter sp. 12S02232-10]PAF48924.1 histidine kinase [Helicobacter sp. 12S02232-10]